jgi:hypothetical protein
MKSSEKFWILDPSIPDVSFPDAQLIRSINMKHSIPFGYTGTALLSPEGKLYAYGLKDTAGRCLGGGVLASRDLEWMASGNKGPKPGDFIPPKGIFSSSKVPQSYLPSEWIAFEYGLLLRGPYGNPFLSSWDQVLAIAKIRNQGKDTHIRIDGNFGEPGTVVFAQANSLGINDLLKISSIVGVPIYN